MLDDELQKVFHQTDLFIPFHIGLFINCPARFTQRESAGKNLYHYARPADLSGSHLPEKPLYTRNPADSGGEVMFAISRCYKVADVET